MFHMSTFILNIFVGTDCFCDSFFLFLSFFKNTKLNNENLLMFQFNLSGHESIERNVQYISNRSLLATCFKCVPFKIIFSKDNLSHRECATGVSFFGCVDANYRCQSWNSADFGHYTNDPENHPKTVHCNGKKNNKTNSLKYIIYQI